MAPQGVVDKPAALGVGGGGEGAATGQVGPGAKVDREAANLVISGVLNNL